MISVSHIAKLARIGLTEEEKQKFEKELSAILEFVEKLNEVDVSGVEPMTGGTELANRYREDEARQISKEDRKKISKNAPKRKDDYIEVLAVFE